MRALGRDTRIVFAVNLCFSLGIGCYSFIMPAYARQLGATPAQFGAMLSAAWAMGTVAVIPGGYLADRHDRRTLMIAGWAMLLACPLLYATARTWVWLIPPHLLFYASFWSSPAFGAYVATAAPPGRAGAVWGTLNAANSLGLVVGPLLGSALVRLIGLRRMFIVAFGFELASLLLLFALTPQPPPAKRRDEATSGERVAGAGGRLGGASARQALGSLLLVGGFFGLGRLLAGLGPPFISLYVQDKTGLDLRNLGLFGSAAALGGLVCSPLVGRLRDVFGARRAVHVALGAVALAYGALLVVRHPAAIFLALIMRGGESALYSLGQAEVGSRAPKAGMGRAYASYNVLVGVCGSIGPSIGGTLYGIRRELPFLGVIGGAGAMAVAAGAVLGGGGPSAAADGQRCPASAGAGQGPSPAAGAGG